MSVFHKPLLVLSFVVLAALAMQAQQMPRLVSTPPTDTAVKVDLSRQDAGYWLALPGERRQQLATVVAHFRVSSIVLEPAYMDNDRILSIIDRTFADSSLAENLDYATVIASASPEGNTAHNEWLAAGRAMAIRRYITSRHPHVDSTRILAYSGGEDWAGLRRMIARDPRTPGKNEALRELDLSLSGDELRQRLRRVAGGATYRYVVQNMLPYLRGGVACMLYLKPKATTDSVIITETLHDSITIIQTDTVRSTDTLRSETQRYPTLDIRTNLLYDAFLLPNIGVEWRPDSTRLGLKVHASYSHWGGEHGRVQKIWLLSAEVRRYLGAKQRLYVGLVADVSEYNVYKLPVGRLLSSNTGYQGWLTSVGISGGYRLPLTKRWAIDFNLALGYNSFKDDSFVVMDNTRYYKEKKRSQSLVGPTQLGVHLIYTVGGGERKKVEN